MKRISFFVVSAFLLAALEIGAQTVELNGVKYQLDTSTQTAAASYADSEIKQAVVVSSVSYDGAEYTVTKLADRAFMACRSLQSVSIPETVASVGSFAFLGCSGLERVDIPSLADWLEISFTDGFSNPLVYAHNLYIADKRLENLVLPEGLVKVPDNAFTGASIATVEFPASVTEIGQLAFYQCESLQSMEAGQSLSTIGVQAFDGCISLKTAVLAPAVTEVCNYAFNDCANLAKVTFGGNVATVGTDAFAGCKALEMVDVHDIYSWCSISFANNAANPLMQAHLLSVGGITVTNLEIPAGITEVKSDAFAGCTAIESVVLGADVTEVGAKAFSSCGALKSVRFDGPVTKIGDSAFEDCANLSDCLLPQSLTQIGEYAFYSTALNEVTVPQGVETLPDGVFGECEQLKAVELPEGLKSLGFGCFYGCTALEKIELPQSLQKIGKSVFYACGALKTVKLGAALESLGGFAFASCKGLTDIYVAATEPPVAPQNVFSTYTATLHVPQGSMTAYEDDDTWGLFSNIQPLEDGVSNILSEQSDITVSGNTVSFGSMPADSMVEIVSIDGRIVYRGAPMTLTLPGGVYIIRTQSALVKAIIR